MSEFLWSYALFAAKAVTVVLAFLVILGAISELAARTKGRTRGRLHLSRINGRLRTMSRVLRHASMPKKAFKVALKDEDKAEAERQKNLEKESKAPPRVFVLDFDGDIRASQVETLRQEITAILTVATPNDEVVVRLESAGGLVNAYGLAASQLARLREKGIPLTVAVDKVAASGGYMMACVGNRIIAAPFAMIGSVGVVAQLPNFNRLLKKHNIDFELQTAGEFKRTLTVFGENTDEHRKKFRADLEAIHASFKAFIATMRPQVDLEAVATGEHWLATQALELKLIDALKTSDDYLMEAAQRAEVFELSYKPPRHWGEKLSAVARAQVDRLVTWAHTSNA